MSDVALQPADKWYNAGCWWAERRNYRRSAASFGRSLRLDPGDAKAWKHRGMGLYQCADYGAADVSYCTALGHNPDDVEAHMMRAFCLFAQHRDEEAWVEWEWRRKIGQNKREFPIPEWNGEPLTGKRILLYCEQGLGDTIMFLRYVPLIRERGAIITLEVQPHLRKLVGNTFPDLAVRIVGDDVGTQDYAYPLLSLARHFGQIGPRGLATYAVNWQSMDGRKRVGLAWAGNPKHENDHRRSIDPALLTPLIEVSQVQWIGLSIEGQCPLGVADFSKQLTDFARTASIIDTLDLVITVDTAVAHIAGTLGRPCWLMLPFVGDWRWPVDSDATPWYPSVRIFHQTEAGNWPAVIERVTAALDEYIPPVLVGEAATRHGPMKFYTNDQWIGRALDRYGEFSQAEIDFLATIIQPGWRVVDGGANIGCHTMAFSEMVGPTGEVLAFEPLPEIFELLDVNVAARANVTLRAVGLGAREYRIEREGLGGAFGGVAEVPTVGIAALDGAGGGPVNFIKLDIEGMELDALRGAEQLIACDRPILYVENDRADKSAGLIEWLLGHGYRCWWHLPPMFSTDNFKANPWNPWRGLVSINMLCLPDGVDHPATAGLVPVLTPADDWRPAA